MQHLSRITLSLLLALPVLSAQQKPNDAVPEQLGKVAFSNSCLPVVQKQFERSVALLHSFAYGAAGAQNSRSQILYCLRYGLRGCVSLASGSGNSVPQKVNFSQIALMELPAARIHRSALWLRF
jgi:hypothetical protein